MNVGAGTESATLATIRRLLLGIVVVGVGGTAVELLLLGHFDGPAQVTPLVLLGLAGASLTWHIAAPAAAAVRTLQLTMMALIGAGVVGVGMHFDGNVEFERELYPSLAGIELVEKTLTGATPVFAPGSLTMLGLVGLAHTYRHPRLRNRVDDQENIP